MNRTDFLIMLIILYIGIGGVYIIHPKPISIIKYPSVKNKDLILKDTNGKIVSYIRKPI